MSHTGTILGISELEIERVLRHDFIEVWVKPTKKPQCKHCKRRNLRIKVIHKRTVKHTRQDNRVLTLHLKVPKYHCRCCGRYFRHTFVGNRPCYRASECFRLEVLEAHHGGVTQRGISRTHRISPTTVERWCQFHISQKYKEIISRPCPEMLGIDEHFFTCKKGYAATLVELCNRSVFDVKSGRSELSLRSYLCHLPGKENVRLIAMDLSETYRNIAKKYFPNATLVADRFHVVRLINHHFLKACKYSTQRGEKTVVYSV